MLKTSQGRLPARITASNTIERPSAHLDARSVVALEFSAFWLHKHASIKVPPAVLIRRGLVLLAEHLSHLEGSEMDREVHTLRDTGKGSGSALSLTQARARIEEHLRAAAAQPMGHSHDALRSIQENREGRESLARVEAHMAALFPEDEGTVAAAGKRHDPLSTNKNGHHQ